MAANFTADAFANAAVDNATNPSQYGHHHGPIPNPNTDWVPDCQESNPRATVSTWGNSQAPNTGSTMSSVNIGVCDIDTGGGIMCGTVCNNQPSLRRHIRTTHPGALTNPTTTNTSIQETAAGQLAIKKFVRDGVWRAAQYLREPGRGPVGGLVDQYATAMEAIARNNAQFANRYGTRFHRERVAVATPASRKRQRGPDVPGDDSDEPSPSAKRSTRRKAGTKSKEAASRKGRGAKKVVEPAPDAGEA